MGGEGQIVYADVSVRASIIRSDCNSKSHLATCHTPPMPWKLVPLVLEAMHSKVSQTI